MTAISPIGSANTTSYQAAVNAATAGDPTTQQAGGTKKAGHHGHGHHKAAAPAPAPAPDPTSTSPSSTSSLLDVIA